MKTKVLSILASVLILLLTSSSIALANSTQADGNYATLRTSDYLTKYVADIESQGDNKIKISFTVRAKTVMDEVGVLQIKIERNSGSGWVYDRTLSHLDYDNFIKNNAISNKSSATFYGISGYRYRATLTAYAADGSGADSKEAYSGSVTCY